MLKGERVFESTESKIHGSFVLLDPVICLSLPNGMSCVPNSKKAKLEYLWILQNVVLSERG